MKNKYKNIDIDIVKNNINLLPYSFRKLEKFKTSKFVKNNIISEIKDPFEYNSDIINGRVIFFPLGKPPCKVL